MHELSIIAGIVHIAEEQVEKSGASAVEMIELEIGELAGVDYQALDFVWELGVSQSVLAGAARRIDHVPGQARCLECEALFHLQALYDACPHCGSHWKDIIRGKELRVKAVTVV